MCVYLYLYIYVYIHCDIPATIVLKCKCCTYLYCTPLFFKAEMSMARGENITNAAATPEWPSALAPATAAALRPGDPMARPLLATAPG